MLQWLQIPPCKPANYHLKQALLYTGSYFNELYLIFWSQVEWLRFLNSILGIGHHAAEDALWWILGKILIYFCNFKTVALLICPALQKIWWNNLGSPFNSDPFRCDLISSPIQFSLNFLSENCSELFLQTPAGDIASNPAKVLQIPRYAKLHAHLHSQSYFPVSLSSWKTSCDIKLVGGPSNIII